MKKYHILVDDIRDLNADIICRNSQSAIRTLIYFVGDVECLYMDHDLGLHSEEDGYAVLKKSIEMGYCPDKVQLVTSNPVGRLNMAELLINDGFIPNINGIDFARE